MGQDGKGPLWFPPKVRSTRNPPMHGQIVQEMELNGFNQTALVTRPRLGWTWLAWGLGVGPASGSAH